MSLKVVFVLPLLVSALIVSSNCASPSACRTWTVPVSRVIICLSWRSAPSEKTSSFERPSIAKHFVLLLLKAPLVCIVSHAASLGLGGMTRSSVRGW